MKHQSTKSVSFFMELMIVICFFTISASVCVFVMSNAYEKSHEADAIKKALLYGQNLIEQQCDVLLQDSFQLDEDGNIVEEHGVFIATVEVIKETPTQVLASLHISKDEKEVSVLEFQRKRGDIRVCE